MIPSYNIPPSALWSDIFDTGIRNICIGGVACQ